jgi:CHAP domain
MRLIRALVGLVLLALTACTSATPPAATAPPQQQALLPLPDGPLECVPYARLVSGIAIRGDAWTWWHHAAPRYGRGKDPRPGAVLVFARTRALSRGHVAVVTRLIEAREILVTHANWANRGRVASDVRVIDISPGNDWSELRVWNGESFGKAYPAHGFIYPGPGAAGV